MELFIEDPLIHCGFSDFADCAGQADTVFVDTETFIRDSNLFIAEIGAVLVSSGEPFADFEQLVNSYVEIGDHPLPISGITVREMERAPSAYTFIPMFMDAVSSLVFAGHNVGYDIRALSSYMDSRRVVHPRVIDTLEQSRRMFPNAPSHSLQSTMLMLGIPDLVEHRALSDALDSYRCWRDMSLMTAPRLLSDDEIHTIADANSRQRQSKSQSMKRDQWLEKHNVRYVNQLPSDVRVLETLECGVDISKNENSQRILSRYSYDDWVWVHVVEGKEQVGKWKGHPTYRIELDGVPIGTLTHLQMSYHCNQVPGGDAYLIAHIPDRREDRSRNRFGLRVHFPARHEHTEI